MLGHFCICWSCSWHLFDYLVVVDCTAFCWIAAQFFPCYACWKSFGIFSDSFWQIVNSERWAMHAWTYLRVCGVCACVFVWCLRSSWFLGCACQSGAAFQCCWCHRCGQPPPPHRTTCWGLSLATAAYVRTTRPLWFKVFLFRKYLPVVAPLLI